MAFLTPLAFLLAFPLSICEGGRLGEYISHYEPLNYDPREAHLIHRRSVMMDGAHYDLKFTAFGREHKLRLRRNTGIFTPDAEIANGDGSPLDIDRNAMVRGEVDGEPDSTVYGTMDEGKFQGKIAGAESFYVEPADRYLENPDFHSVIYRSEDVENRGNFGDISKQMPSILDRKKRETSEDRPRRATDAEKKKDSCTLAIYADHLFTKLFGSKIQAVFKLVEHVTAVQIIYKNAFNTSKLDLYDPYGITFRVKKMVIYDSSDVPGEYKVDNIGIDPMLKQLSAQNHDDVCSAFMFTDRDFDGGILGLAWIGNPSTLGGVCSKYTKVGGKDISYNTGVVTMKLYKRFTPPKVSEITFAHELGHNFGSQHDPKGQCTPGGAQGNYIMYSKATSGDRPNNNLFSTCSLKSIRDNINAKRSNSRYSGCFVSATTPICGNRIIEGNEQCDCGDTKSCIAEGNCCNPPAHRQECRLRPTASCSPSQGPCCGKNCRYSGNTTPCHNKTECMERSMCSGASFTCPTSINNPETTECEGSRRVCSAGQCSKSICTKFSLEECQCTTKEDFCGICCKNPGEDKCTSARLLPQLPKKLHDLKKVPGTPCDNMRGYCDAFQVCRIVDQSGPLKRLKEKFFTVKGLKELVKQYWWAILLGIIGAILLVGLMLFFCARYTPSSNPIKENKKPAKTIPGRKKKPGQGARQLQPINEHEQQV